MLKLPCDDAECAVNSRPKFEISLSVEVAWSKSWTETSDTLSVVAVTPSSVSSELPATVVDSEAAEDDVLGTGLTVTSGGSRVVDS